MKVLDKIPTMHVRETMKLWTNAVAILADKNRSRMHNDARSVIDAVNQEWDRRGQFPAANSEYFSWPTTEAPMGAGFVDAEYWLREGVLRHMGYKVGRTKGLERSVREKILCEIFRGAIPPVFPRHYVNEWGSASTPARLRK